jgi:hypothetical protein
MRRWEHQAHLVKAQDGRQERAMQMLEALHPTPLSRWHKRLCASAQLPMPLCHL